MNILYFLEPREELNNPLFRLGSVRNHISKEILALNSIKRNECDVRLLTSDKVAIETSNEKLIPDKFVFTISQKKLKEAFPDERAISSAWYNGSFTKNDVKIMNKLCKSSLGSWKPDLIVCYESAAPYFSDIFPNALFLNSTLGLLSRAPFPELGCFDPFGVFKDSFIRKFSSELKNFKITVKQSNLLKNFCATYSSFIEKNNPIKEVNITKGFDKVILVPLQVSGYFAFDDNLPDDTEFNSQLDFLRHVLNEVDSTIGVYVTLHGAEDDFLTIEVLKDLQHKFPNFLYKEEVQKVRWCSQWILPYVDAVATVSSSVGLQAVLWGKPVFVYGHSHLATFNAGKLSAAHDIIENKNQSKNDYEGALFYLLTRYYPLMSSKLDNGDWLYNFYEQAFNKFKNGKIDFNFYDEPADEEVVFNELINNLQHEKTLFEIEKYASHLPSTRLVDLKIVKKDILINDVISFDIFDTLISRCLMHPNHVFDLMDKEAESIFSKENIRLSDFGGFRNLRERAANRIIRSAKRLGNEEIIFNDIYNEIKLLTNLSDHAIVSLRKLELLVERNVMVIRDTGRELFDFAKKSGKKIILVSDMYLPVKEVEFLLKKLGYSGYEKCFVSSEYNKVKKSGSLYSLVLKEFPNQKILHLGDNHLSDVLKATEAGISAVHLPIINETYLASRLSQDILSPPEVSDSLDASLMHGVISRQFYDNSVFLNGWFDSSPYRMGFEACGPILLGFTKWILEQSIRDGVEDLYFLARDGYLVKKIYDKISVNVANAPKSHYLLASRRCYNTANLKSEQDILDSLSLSFSKVPLYKILEARFALSQDEIDPLSIKLAGLDSLEQIVDIKRKSQLNKLKRFLSINKDIILKKAEVERINLLEYLNDQGLNSNRKKSIVDIGHNASLQRSLGSMLGYTTDIGGYYFMTYQGAKDVYDLGFDVKGYLADFEDSKCSTHPYCKNIGMFEFLFLPAIPSFKRFTKKNGVLQEEYVDGDETARFKVIKKVHNGVIGYINNIYKVMGGDVSLYNVSKNRSLKTYVEFIQSPHQNDALIFNGLSFVDQFGGSDARYLIASPVYPKVSSDNYSDYIRDSWWREGAAVLVNGTSSQRLQQLKGNSRILNNEKISEHNLSIFKRKWRKLKNNPKSFWIDSKIRKIIFR